MFSLRSVIKRYDTSVSESYVTPSDIWASMYKSGFILAGSQARKLSPRESSVLAIHAPPQAVLEVAYPSERRKYEPEKMKYQMLVSSAQRIFQPSMNMAAQRNLLYQNSLPKPITPRKRGRPPKSKSSLATLSTAASEADKQQLKTKELESDAAAVAAGVLSQMNNPEDVQSNPFKRQKETPFPPVHVFVLPAFHDSQGVVIAEPAIPVLPQAPESLPQDEFAYCLESDEGASDFFL
jgi:hypothetical protein